MNAESNTIVVAQPTNRVSSVRLGREQDAGMALFPPGQLPQQKQVPADWGQNDDTQPDYIKNKPAIPAAPADIGAAAEQHSHAQADVTGLADALAAKQDAISDLATIRSGAKAGATAVQPAALHYSLPIAVSVTDASSTAALQDRAVNTVQVGAAVTTLNLTFPAAVAGCARDFFLRIDCGSSTALATIALPSGETVDFGADALAGLTGKAGVHLALFTEIAANHWLVSAKESEA